MTEPLPAALEILPAKRLEDVSQTAALKPLDAGDRRYVDLREGQATLDLGMLRECLAEIAGRPGTPMTDEDYAKIVFSGHRGSGKTTELKLIEREFSDRFYALHLTLDDNLLHDIDYTLFLLSLCEQLVESFARDGMPIDERIVEEVGRWFVERTETEVDESALAGSLGAEAELSLGAKVLGIGAKLIGRVKTEARGSITRRVEIRNRLQRYAGDLLNRVNSLLAEARDLLTANGRPARLLVVQDNLDRLTGAMARAFFADTGDLLRQVRAHVLFTAPVATALTPFKISNVFPDAYAMPMIKTCTQDGQPFEPGLAIMRELVTRRIDPALFSGDDVIRRLCHASGGSVRDLVRLAGQAARIAKVLKRPSIDDRCVDEAMKILRIEYEKLLVPGAKYYPRLATIHRTKMDGGTATDGADTLRDLLDNGAVLEYQNGENWYDVHPAIRESRAFQDAVRANTTAATGA